MTLILLCVGPLIMLPVGIIPLFYMDLYMLVLEVLMAYILFSLQVHVVQNRRISCLDS